MAYIDYGYYKSLYGVEELKETDFNRLVWEAERELDKATTGVDGVRKLQIAFPSKEYDAETVKRCACTLVYVLHQIELAEKNANSVGQYMERADGSLQGKVVSSVSAGNESISYAVGKSSETATSAAIKSVEDREKTIYSFIASKLSGVPDANGINLLYAGPYLYMPAN